MGALVGICLTQLFFAGCAAPEALSGPALYRQIQREEASLDEAVARADKAATCEELRVFEDNAGNARMRLCSLANAANDRDARERCFRADDHARAVLAQARTRCGHERTP